jgi:hypothetical protein
MKDAVGVDVKDPGGFVKSLLQLANIIVIECIDVELHNSHYLVVVICSRCYGDFLLFNPTFPICRSIRPSDRHDNRPPRRSSIRFPAALALRWRGDEGLQ